MAIQHPSWLDHAIFYQIYPQSFYDTNDDGIGDLKGIIQKLPYLKGVGFNAVWISPFFDSTFFDAGYDVCDYKKVAPRYGTNQDAYALFKAAHKLGMKVILDFVPGHTSIYHPWFKASCLEKKNPYTDRYIWSDHIMPPDPETHWVSGISERTGSYMVNFFSIQPALNYGFAEIRHPWEQRPTDPGPQSTIKDMIDILLFWLSQGADGFRCDCAASLVKRDPDKKETAKVWQKMIGACKEKYPDCVFISEWSNAKQSLSGGFDIDFVLAGDTGYPLCRGNNPYFRFDAAAKEFDSWWADRSSDFSFADQKGKFVSFTSGNHDVNRIRSSLSEEEIRYYYLFLLTVKNVPFFYYGDEIGMSDETGIPSTEGAYGRQVARSPMQWDESKTAGFSSASKTYIKIPPMAERKGISVVTESSKKDSLLNYVKELIALKNQHPALDNDAAMKFRPAKDAMPLVYERSKGNEKLFVAFNLGPEPKRVAFLGYQGNILYSLGAAPKVADKTILLAPHSAVVMA